jgi:hypothetical protein
MADVTAARTMLKDISHTMNHPAPCETSLRHLRCTADENGVLTLVVKPRPLRPEAETCDDHRPRRVLRKGASWVFDWLFNPVR